MDPQQITPPNTCALLYDSLNVAATLIYIEADPASIIYPGDDIDTFEEFLTPQDAVTRALVLDPSYDITNILGPIPYTETVSGGGNYAYGDPVSLNYVVSSTLAGIVITYQWTDGDGIALAGETGDTLSLGGASATIEGVYVCNATLTATDGRVQETFNRFRVITSPIAAEFTLTRSGNDITTGLFTFLKGFAASTATLEVPAIPLTISYDPTDGFKTTGSPLLALDQVAEIFVNGEFVSSVTIHSVDGTFNYNFSA